jgi:hypothetical protein
MDSDLTKDLPGDLAAALKDHSVFVSQDASVFRAIARWSEAPSSTVSAEPLMTTEAVLSAVPSSAAEPSTTPARCCA